MMKLLERRRLILTLLIIYWIAHAFVWGFWGWRDYTLFSPQWWFDEAGHAIFGFMGAFTLLYIIRTYVAGGIFRLASHGFVMFIVVAGIAFIGWLWEVFELTWDFILQPNYFDWLATAQNTSIDTSIDLAVNPLFAFFAVLLYRAYNAWYEARYPEYLNTHRIEGVIHEIEKTAEEVRLKHKSIRKKDYNAWKKRLEKIFEGLGE